MSNNTNTIIQEDIQEFVEIYHPEWDSEAQMILASLLWDQVVEESP